jgi:hypothetical protein
MFHIPVVIHWLLVFVEDLIALLALLEDQTLERQEELLGDVTFGELFLTQWVWAASVSRLSVFLSYK